MSEVIVKMSGKVLISGEHSVVYGYPAIVASLDKGVNVTVKQSPQVKNFKGLIKEAALLSGVETEGLEIIVGSDIPIGSGLGSSAAVSAGVIKALWLWDGRKFIEDELFEKTWEAEKLIHGNSSGVDPAAVVYGGVLQYTKGTKPKRIKVRQPLKIWLVNTGKPKESTGEMVAAVGKRHQLPDTRNQIKQIGEITRKIVSAIEENLDFHDLININGLLLEELGVVGTKAKAIADKLRNRGYAVKVVGAGGVADGSGMMMVYGNDYTQAMSIIKKLGLTGWPVIIGGE